MATTTDDVIKQVKGYDKTLNSTIDAHQERLKASIRKLEQNIVDQFRNLKTGEKGELLTPRVNLKQAQKIHSRLGVMFEEDYGKGVRRNMAGFNEVAEAIVGMYRNLDVAMEFTSVDAKMMEALRDQNLQQFAQFGQAAQDKVAQAMYDSIIAGAPFSALEATMAGILSGGADARGRSLAAYATQHANDSLMNFQQAVHVKKGREAGLKSWLYYGNIITTTRPFCIDRAGKVFTDEQIRAWDDLVWAGKSGPAMTNRGGYNCRHHWVPVKKAWLPEGYQPGDALTEQGISVKRGTTLKGVQKQQPRRGTAPTKAPKGYKYVDITERKLELGAVPPQPVLGDDFVDLYHVTYRDDAKKIMDEGLFRSGDFSAAGQTFESATKGTYGWATRQRAAMEIERIGFEVGEEVADEMVVMHVRVPRKQFASRFRADEDWGADLKQWEASYKGMQSIAVEGNIETQYVQAIYSTKPGKTQYRVLREAVKKEDPFTAFRANMGKVLGENEGVSSEMFGLNWFDLGEESLNEFARTAATNKNLYKFKKVPLSNIVGAGGDDVWEDDLLEYYKVLGKKQEGIQRLIKDGDYYFAIDDHVGVVANMMAGNKSMWAQVLDMDDVRALRGLGKAEAGAVKALYRAPGARYATTVPEFKTVEEAKKYINNLIKKSNKGTVQYATRSNGQPHLRFNHADTARVTNARWGGMLPRNRIKIVTTPSYVGVDDGDLLWMQHMANKLKDFELRCDALGIPRLRGVHVLHLEGAGANMGDGIMGANLGTFRHFANSASRMVDQAATIASFEKRIASWEEMLSRPGINEGLRKKLTEDLAWARADLEKVKTGKYPNLTSLSRESSWHQGDKAFERPVLGNSYYTDSLESMGVTMDHEFGHHIHQQLFASDFMTVQQPPLETYLDRLRHKWYGTPTGMSPSSYGDTNAHEWFAENYSLWVNDRRELVTPALKPLLEKLDDLGTGAITKDDLLTWLKEEHARL